MRLPRVQLRPGTWAILAGVITIIAVGFATGHKLGSFAWGGQVAMWVWIGAAAAQYTDRP